MLVRCLAMMHGGGETRHLAWARELRARGVDVEIITGRPLIGQARFTEYDVPVRVLRSPYTRDLVYRLQGKRVVGRFASWLLHADEELFCRLAWRSIQAEQPRFDVVHAHALHQAARLRPAGCRQPVVINLPGPPHPRYRADLRRADALISDGWGAAQLPAQLGMAVVDVPKGVDTRAFQPDGASQRAALGLADARVVLCVARLVPIKNVGLLLEAAALARQQEPRLQVVVVGEGPQRAMLERQARRLGLADSVTFAGHVPHAELPAWYRAADVFALPSHFDNSPNVVLEAFASGLPVVATDTGGLRQYVRPEENGLLAPDGDAARLAEALLRYARDPRLARAVGEHNRVEAEARYAWQASAAALFAVYQRLLGYGESRGASPDTPGSRAPAERGNDGDGRAPAESALATPRPGH